MTHPPVFVSHSCRHLPVLVLLMLLAGCVGGLFPVRTSPPGGKAAPTGDGAAPAAPNASAALLRGGEAAVNPPGPTPPSDAAARPDRFVSPPPGPSPVQPRKPKPSRFTRVPDIAYRNQTLTEDVTWRGQVLVEGYLEVAPQATVVVDPGTTVRFRPDAKGGEGTLVVRGRLSAVGTGEEPVIFTPDGTDPAAGDWQGIIFMDSRKKNLLERCLIEGAVTGVEAFFSDLVIRETTFIRNGVGLALHESSVVVARGGVEGGDPGISVTGGDTDVSGLRISGTLQGVAISGGSLSLSGSEVTGTRDAGLVAVGARLRLEGTRFVDNGTGVTVDRCEGDLVSNLLERNRDAGLDLADSPLRITGNRISGNGTAGVRIRRGVVALWGNAIVGNGVHDLVNEGGDRIAALGNWWGSADPALVRSRIREACPGRPCGKVTIAPLLDDVPRSVPGKPLGNLP